MVKKLNDDAFLRDLKEQRQPAGMVMNKPPTGKSISLEEMLGAQSASSSATVAAHGEVASPDDISVQEQNYSEQVQQSNQPVSGFVELDVSLIDDSPYQVRLPDEMSLEDLMVSIQDTDGIVTPIIVRKHPNGRYECIGGHTRLKAYRRLEKGKVPAVVREMSDMQACRSLAADNLIRKDLEDYEIYLQLKTLFADGGVKSNSEAARFLGRRRQEIIRYMAYGKLPGEVLSILEKKPSLFGATLAKDLEALVDSQTELVIKACDKLYSGELKSQNRVLPWITSQLTPQNARNEFTVVDDKGARLAKVSITASGGINISGKDLDVDNVIRLLREHLPRCKKVSS